jgi:SAM-dependent methyltransferase
MRPTALIKRVLSDSSVRMLMREGAYFPTDIYEMLSGKRKPLIPPRGMRSDDAESYVAIGKAEVKDLMEFCELKPHHVVLDVGCATGRMAAHLLDYLKSGAYFGFDIVPSWTKWSQNNIARQHPNFHFTWVDVYSRHYNSSGRIRAEEFVFPYENNKFDCALVASVFTHMLPGGIRNYLCELSRVMKTGAKAFVTVFLLNEESTQGIKEGKSAFPFHHSHGNCFVVDPQFPETAIAIPEPDLRIWCSEANLKLTVTNGSWPGRSGCRTVHDSLVVEKS